jgi:hypothetical protein
MKATRILMACFFISMITSLPSQVQAQELSIQDYHGVKYVSGGVGQDERDYLSSIQSQFNLVLMFAAQSGEFLSSVHVVINGRGQGTVLDAVADGPYFYAVLPPGSYTVTASLDGKSTQRQITVGAGRLTRVDFYWR